MTKEEKLKILEEAEERCYRALKTVEPGKDMGYIMENLSSLHWRADFVRNPQTDDFVPEPDCDKGEAKPKKKVELDPIEEPTPVNPEPKDTGAEPKITKEDVRKKLAMYQTNANLDVPSLMQSMGYSKLSEVPASRYWELLEKAQKTVDGEG